MQVAVFHTEEYLGLREFAWQLYSDLAQLEFKLCYHPFNNIRTDNDLSGFLSMVSFLYYEIRVTIMLCFFSEKFPQLAYLSAVGQEPTVYLAYHMRLV